MLKKIIVAVILAFPLCGYSQTFPYTCITKDDPTILRSGPSTDFDRIVELPKGLKFSVEANAGNWSRIRLSKALSGWVESKSIVSAGLIAPVSQPILRYIQVKREERDVKMEILESEPGAVVFEEWLQPRILWMRFQNTTSALSEIDYDPKDNLIRHIAATQETEDVVALKIDLRSFYGYETIQKDSTHLIIKFRLKPPKQASLKGWKVCLDPGHGGKDTGAVGPSGFQEKEATLAIASALGELLKAKGATLFFTRTSDISLVDPNAPAIEELEKRVEVAREKEADLFISIHCNSRPTVAEGRIARGSYVYFYQPQSMELAEIVSKNLEKRIDEPKYGIIFRSFHVIRESDMPAILVETVFISNEATEAKLKDKHYQSQIAKGIAEGILQYVRGI